MSLCTRLAFRLRQAADALERAHRRSHPKLHPWEINRRAKQFVADHAHLDLDELTDLAIQRGIYSSKQSRKTVHGHITWLRTMRVLQAPSHSAIRIPRSEIRNRELLRS